MSDDAKLGLNATWSMAVGGMVGGGIFSVLGVVVSLAGGLAWLSFVVAGLIALATAFSYVALADELGEGGGAFSFLRAFDHDSLAASLSWFLIVGYVLTMSVYAFTFGHYLGEVLGLGGVAVRGAAVSILVALVVVNLRGVGDAARLEIVAVWAKLAVLLALAAIGLWRFDSANLGTGVPTGDLSGVIVGAASVFMAYEGFQLLTYDYDDIHDPKRTLRLGVLSAVAVVIGVYVVVTLGAVSLVGAGTVVEQKEVALAAAGKEALGTAGLVAVSVGAVFAAASAINATLFATARLARRVADDGELPAAAASLNSAGIPDRAVMALGATAGAIAVVGSIATLVEAASLRGCADRRSRGPSGPPAKPARAGSTAALSAAKPPSMRKPRLSAVPLTFLMTFAAVNVIAARRAPRHRLVSWAGAVGAGVAALVLTARLLTTRPLTLALLAAMVVVATLGRPKLLARLKRPD